MRILLASSEVYPYSKTGGLADAVGALGKALAKAGHQVGIVTPLYRGIRERFPKIQKADWRFDLPLGARRVGAELWTLEATERLTLYFIHQPSYFDRAGLYGYKCLPHLGLGMVGVIQVGNAANRAQLQAAAAKLPGLGKKRMTALLAS